MRALSAALFGLAAAAASGCVQKNASHCANLAGDATCAERGGAPLCSKCTSENDGCVGTVEVECAVGVGTTEDGPTASTTVGGTAESSGTDDSTSGGTTSEEESSSSSTGGPPAPFCGDGVKNGTETCDGDDLGGLDCSGLNYNGGTLACDGDCDLDLSGCMGMNECGNMMLDPGEACDDTMFGDQTCASVMGPGFEGELICNANGCFIDPSNCCKPDNQLCQYDWECCSGHCKVLGCGLL